MIDKKKKILESWIMVEHLSEGDIDKNDKSLLNFGDMEQNDYHSFILSKLREKKIYEKKRRGGNLF